MNSTLLGMLRTLSESDKPNWHRHVNKLVAAYNATTHSTTGYSPYFLLYGRTPVLPLDVILGQRPEVIPCPQSYSNFVTDWEERMTEAYNITRANNRKAKEASEERWKKHLTASRLQPGDKVLVKNKRETGGPGKLRAFWEQEIYVVIAVKEDGVVYQVQGSTGEKRVLHRNMLLPCDSLELDANTSEPRIPTQATAAVTRSRRTRRRIVCTAPGTPFLNLPPPHFFSPPPPPYTDPPYPPGNFPSRTISRNFC
jgi:hypothetical protein